MNEPTALTAGTHYNYFRDFDPSIGRYIQSDPIGLDGGLNTYAYGGSNPLINIDPEGLTYFCMYSQFSGRLSCFDNDGRGKQVIDGVLLRKRSRPEQSEGPVHTIPRPSASWVV